MAKPGVGPIRHGTMRERNLALLLAEISDHQPVTRAGLAGMTGFTKTTVSNLVAVLADAGLVRDGEPVHEGERGRPGVAVTVNGDGAAGLGLEVNVDYLAACVIDLGRRVRYRHTVEVDNRGRSPEAIAESLARLAAGAVASAEEQSLVVVGAVTALPGLLDQDGVVHSPNLGWIAAPVRELLADRLPPLRLPVDIENEANLAALGELWFGAGTSLGDFLHVSGEVGVGAAVVVNGEIFRGAHGYAGELGHVVVVPDGPLCACGGHGCLERVAGQEAILQAAGLGHLTVGSSGVSRQSVSVLVGRLQEGDPTALAAVAAAGRALGAAVASAVKLLDPDTVVLGGLYSVLAHWVVPPVEDAVRAGALYGSAPSVVVSPLGGDAAVLGAAGLVIERVYADPGLLTR